ncbi:MAG: hypothetical protein EZS28_018605 [Streblomastix strix]|uniref:Uncharacterized protein n=1 Tax=Streblomastix strix TaxID=222440 RepID=A0A5J4VTG8_9EUKA|nr:MAG: hypothetical protein EZS28_018605 [Streblomastix strix]
MSTLITIPTKIVICGEIDGALNDLIEAKAAYDTVVEKHLINQLTLDSKLEILTTIVGENFKMKYPHTPVLFDDAMSIFKNKQLPLFKKLFKNRQSRITYFLCLQDIIGLDANKVWEQYINLTKKQALIVQYSNDGTKIKIQDS